MKEQWLSCKLIISLCTSEFPHTPESLHTLEFPHTLESLHTLEFPHTLESLHTPESLQSQGTPFFRLVNSL